MLKKVYLALCSVLVIFHLYTGAFGIIAGIGQRAIHLLLIIAILFLRAFMKDENPVQKAVDLLFIAFGVSSTGYVLYIQPTYDMRGGITYPIDVFFGILLIATLIYATYKTVGPSLSIVSMCFIAYAFLGRWMPAVLQHSGFKLSRFIHLIVYSPEGIFGVALNASANYIVLFIILGAVFNVCGVGDYFTSLAMAAFGKMTGGPAKVAVIASGLFGSISGSSIANVISTGTFTIPMMKKCGFEPEEAGAVEAASSTGGQIMPPIMGSAAFLVAEILQVPYFQIVKSAFIPAILYFGAVLMSVDLYARRRNIKGVDASQLPDLHTMLERVYLFFPLIALIVFIGPLHMTVTKGGVYTLILTLIITSFSKENRINLKKVEKVAISSADGTIPVAVACAVVGIVIGTVTGSGLGYRLSTLLVSISGGKIIVLLVLTMLTSIILGMGLPTSACYLVLATLVAPALIQLNVVAMGAHLFILYFGVISSITPPVALTAFAAAGLARCNPNKCGWRAFQLALSGFILPFMFVFNPTLLCEGTWYAIVYSFITALFGIYLLSSAVQGYYIKWPISKIERVLFLGAALLMIDSGMITDLAGIIIAGGLFVYHVIQSKRVAAV